MVGGSSAEPHRELSGDGARKDVTSQAHVKVAIYKQVIARVTTQLSLRQRRILLFISPPPACCSNARLCPSRAAVLLPASKHHPGTVPGPAAPRGARRLPWVTGALPPRRGLACHSRAGLRCPDHIPTRGFLGRRQMHLITHTCVHKHHAYVNTCALFCLMS